MFKAEPQDGLPPYGPRALAFPDASAFREGYVVKFTTDSGETWVGNFATWDKQGLSAVHLELGPRAVFVVAGSIGYMVDIKTKLVREVGIGIAHSWFEDGLQAIVISDGLSFEAFNEDRLLWESRRFSFDGIRNLQRHDLSVTGEAYDPSSGSDCWLPFRLDLVTGDVKGGSRVDWPD